MKRILSLACLIIIVLLILPVATSASDITNAWWQATVRVTNNGTAATNVSTVFTMNGTAWINAGYVNSTLTDIVIRRNGVDVPFMPPQPTGNKAVMFVDSISASISNDYEFYSDNASGGAYRYFPGSAGMAVTDHASLEPSANFTITLNDTFISSTTNISKPDALSVTYSGGNLLAYIPPSVAATNNSATGVANTNHTVSLPSGIASGHLLLVGFSCPSTSTVSFPGGWSNLVDSTGGGMRLVIKYRVADGTEGASITVTTSGSVESAHLSYRITNYSGTPEVGTSATSTSINPNPPSVTPSWGSTPTLWLPFSASGTGNPDTYSAYPASYTNGFQRGTATGSPDFQIASARRLLFAASEDPGTFTTGLALPWVTNTVAIKPLSLSAAVSQAEHDIVIVANGTNFTMTVDTIEVDSEALNGTSVPDNANNWTFNADYIGSMEVTVGGNQKGYWSWQYAATFTDQSGNGNTGTPTFRTTTSDADVTASLIDFKPVQYSKVATYSLSAAYEILQSNLATPTGMFTEGDYSKIPAAPINEVLDESGVPRAAWWMPFVFLSIAILGMIVYGATTQTWVNGKMREGQLDGSLLMMFIIMEAGLVVFGKMNVIPYWPAFLFPIAGVALILSKKHYGWG